MTPIKLYKFIEKRGIEYHWEDYHFMNYDIYVSDVIMMVDIPYLEEFYKMLSVHIFDDEGIECYLKDGYICFWMKYICDQHDIELEEVFDR